MDSDEIVSARKALLYLSRGDDPAKRARLAVILTTVTLLLVAVAFSLVIVVLSLIS